MKNIFLILLFSLSFHFAFTQDRNYSCYKNQFKKVENFPASNNFIYNIVTGENNIPEDEILRYLNVKNKAEASHRNNYYYYGLTFESAKNDCMLVQKISEVPDSDYYQYNVGETILAIYDKCGKRVSQSLLSKIGDMYYPVVAIPNDSTIFVVQSTLLTTPQKEPYYVTVDYLKFTIKPDGSVAQTKYKPSTKGELIFEQNDIKKQIDRFILVDGKRQVAVE